MPAPIDAYAHLVGKAGSDHLNEEATARLDEIARMARRLKAPPESVARHLAHCGMRRVARYVLPLVHRSTGDPFAQEVHQRLPSDPIGVGIASVAKPVLARASADSKVGALMAHMLNDSLPRGAYSGGRALFLRSRRA